MAGSLAAGHRWTLGEYVLRCEQGQDLREIIVEGELDREILTDALRRWKCEGVSVLDADYIQVSDEDIELAGVSRGAKGTLLTLVSALELSQIGAELATRIAIVVDRDYDEDVVVSNFLFLTDGYSLENYALTPQGLSRFANAALGRAPLPAGREGQTPERRIVCSGDEIYDRIVGGLSILAGLRLTLRTLNPPVSLFASWLDYARITSAGCLEVEAERLLQNVLSSAGRVEEAETLRGTLGDMTDRAVRDVRRLVRGRDFVEVLRKLLDSSWGRRRGGHHPARVGARHLSRLLLFAMDTTELDSSTLFSGLKTRFTTEVA